MGYITFVGDNIFSSLHYRWQFDRKFYEIHRKFTVYAGRHYLLCESIETDSAMEKPIPHNAGLANLRIRILIVYRIHNMCLPPDCVWWEAAGFLSMCNVYASNNCRTYFKLQSKRHFDAHRFHNIFHRSSVVDSDLLCVLDHIRSPNFLLWANWYFERNCWAELSSDWRQAFSQY